MHKIKYVNSKLSSINGAFTHCIQFVILYIIVQLTVHYCIVFQTKPSECYSTGRRSSSRIELVCFGSFAHSFFHSKIYAFRSDKFGCDINRTKFHLFPSFIVYEKVQFLFEFFNFR